MGTLKFIEKFCVQTCVYWGSPVNNGTGHFTFDFPVEISCRWENSDRVMTDANGKQFTCQAQILVKQELDKGGYLMLGTLAELDEIGALHNRYDAKAEPLKVETAYEIRQFDKIPWVKSSTVFVYKAFI